MIKTGTFAFTGPGMVLCALHLINPMMAADWETTAEKTGYQKTARYEEVYAFCERLAAASPLVQLSSIGLSPEGRKIPLLVVSREPGLRPTAGGTKGRETVLVIACIHPGECEGKDAGLALVREMAITGKARQLLEQVDLLFLPMFGVDGHERFGRFNRINQNGPEQMGWRTTAQNYNLNRDFLKADSPEMRAWLKVFHQWWPDLVIDTHTTDGMDYQYDLTYGLEMGANLHPSLVEWQKKAFEEGIFPALEKKGHLIAPYLSLRNENNPEEGFRTDAAEPRYSTGYGAIQNRPTLLVETHMLKSYQTRVLATYDLLLETLAWLNRHPGELRARVKLADADSARLHRTLPLAFTNSETPGTFQFRGFAWTKVLSEVSGSVWVRYDPARPVTVSLPFYDKPVASRRVTTPAAYLVPAWLPEVAERLRWHGLQLEELTEPLETSVETYFFSDVAWEAAPFENHVRIKNVTVTPVKRVLPFPRGSFRVPLNQRGSNAAVHLLEPDGPDSLVRWGYLNFIFEQKEYGENYVLEKLAREMMKSDPALKAEFEKRIATDASFAANPGARLDFFYQRSPYADARLNLYPIGRVMKE